MSSNCFITDEIKSELKYITDKFEKNVLIKGYLDKNTVSNEIKNCLNDLSSLSEKISVEFIEDSEETLLPAIKLFNDKNEYTGLSYCGVPGGHEFNSFILALYNIAGKGQEVAESTMAKIESIDKKLNIKVVISQSCTMCPELVQAAFRIASLNDNVETEVLDIQHFPYLKKEYKIMSVPCLILNDDKNTISFGKKNIEETLNFIISKIHA